MDAVKDIYNYLFSIEKNKAKGKSYPIHKKAFFGNNIQDISEWINENLSISDDARILDAGCGTGYTLFELCKGNNRSGIGISLSKDEIQFSNKCAEDLNLNEKCSFKIHDFNVPLYEYFDVIIGIESLKHSKDLESTILNLSNSLKPNGQLIIVEDFYVEEVVHNDFGRKFLENWVVQELYTEERYLGILRDKGLGLVSIYDFTNLLKMKNPFFVRLKILLLELIQKFIYSEKNKKISRILLGAWIMEYFYAKGAFKYKLLMFKK